MLLQFSVENFKSFKNREVLSLEASVDRDLADNVLTIGKERCLKTVAIFGANASGKTNLFSALTSAILMVRNSNIRQVNERLDEIVPYRFDREATSKPTSFEFVFMADGKKYVYGFSATREAVTNEYLYVFNTAKASTVFERTSSKEFRYTSPAIRRELKPLEERNTENKLFLATAAMWNSESVRVPFTWFQKGINTYSTDFDRLVGQVATMFEDDKDNSLRRFTTNILHEADINIDDYEFEMRDITEEQLPQELRNIAATSSAVFNKSVRIETIHTVQDGADVQQYKLGLQEESKGTRHLFLFSPILKRAFETGETVCIDELDASLHPILITYLVGLFNNTNINKKNAQLIVSSHSMELLSLKELRRDQIYFIEKDNKTGVSELYSLDEFSLRRQENVRKAYLLGRYGSIPKIAEESILWE